MTAQYEEKIWSALSTSNQTFLWRTAEIALVAGVPLSTTGKILNRWHREGKIVKSHLGLAPGEEPGIFTPVRWSLPGTASDRPHCDDDRQQPLVEEVQMPSPVEVPEKKPRSRRGELRDKILTTLREAHEEEFSPSVLARELGHSSGAVTYALDRLVATGYATQTQDHPKRYRAKGLDYDGFANAEEGPVDG